MIYVTDNVFDKEIFAELQNYCRSNDFKIVKLGNKEYSILDTPNEILPLLQLDGYTLVLSFIRSAYATFDTDLRVHADNIIAGEKIEMAGVLYINDQEGVTKNGTCFWKHHKHGMELPKTISKKEFDTVLTDDANIESKWEKTDIVTSVPNRMLMYKANYFHSKWPKVIEQGERMVLVAFYKTAEPLVRELALMEKLGSPGQYFLMRKNVSEVDILYVDGRFKAIGHLLTKEERIYLRSIKAEDLLR